MTNEQKIIEELGEFIEKEKCWRGVNHYVPYNLLIFFLKELEEKYNRGKK